MGRIPREHTAEGVGRRLVVVEAVVDDTERGQRIIIIGHEPQTLQIGVPGLCQALLAAQGIGVITQGAGIIGARIQQRAQQRAGLSRVSLEQIQIGEHTPRPVHLLRSPGSLGHGLPTGLFRLCVMPAAASHVGEIEPGFDAAGCQFHRGGECLFGFGHAAEIVQRPAESAPGGRQRWGRRQQWPQQGLCGPRIAPFEQGLGFAERGLRRHRPCLAGRAHRSG